MSEPNFAELLAHLDLVVLEHSESATFHHTGSAPAWWHRLVSGASQPREFLDRFPFLRTFWKQARQQLAADASPTVRSSAWFETDAAGASYKLRATAVHCQGRIFLVIEGRRLTNGREHGSLEPPLPDHTCLAPADTGTSLQQTAGARPTGDTSRPPEPLRILVTEDNPNNQRLVVLLLKDRGHVVHVANDGEEAVALFEREDLDAILMDCQMPNMDGFEATQQIRRIEAKRGGHVPIIALTAFAMVGDRERCLTAGMDAYIAKPVQQAKLFETIERLGRAA